MLYIHKLSQLAPKSAEVESVYLIREIKQRTPYPLTEQKLQEYLAPFLVQEEEKTKMFQSLELLEPTTRMITNILLQRDPVHEVINIQRAIKTLKEMPEDLQRNLSYIDEILEAQKRFISEITALMNIIPTLKTSEEKRICNLKLKQMFESILRNKEFFFNFMDIINEAHVSHILALRESMKEGFFFHISLEDELKKKSFEERKIKIPSDKLEEADHINNNLITIEKGIKTAYDINMRQVNLALVLYAYVKWLNGMTMS